MTPSNKKMRVLLIEDSENDALITSHMIKKAGYQVQYQRVDSAEQMKTALKEQSWDIILSDYKMPNFNGMEALKQYKEAGLDIPFIIISGTIGEDVAVEAMKMGAHDYIIKDKLQRLVPAIERELREAKIRTERRLLAEKQQKAEQERLAHLHYFESMEQINRSIQSTNDLELMMREVLDAVQKIFDCDRAFLMFPCDPNAQTWSVPMERTKPEYPGLYAQKDNLNIDKGIASTCKILLDANGPIKFGPESAYPIAEDVAKQFQVKSFLGMALYPKTGKPWEFGLHQCEYERIWTDEEARLFQEIGRRISDSLTSLLSYRYLSESEERYRLIAENTADTINIFDLDLKSRYVSPAVKKLRGYTVAEAIQQSLDEILTPDSLEKANTILTEQLELEVIGQIEPDRTVLLELEEYHKDGSTIWVEVAATFIRDNKSIPSGILTITRDISERKRAEETLRKLSHAVEQSPASMIVTDRNGNIEYANPKYLEISGYSLDEVIGKDLKSLLSKTHKQELYEELWETIKAGREWRGEYQNEKKNGELYWESVSISPVCDPAGNITHFLEIIEDITDRKHLEEQIRQAQKMEAIGQLAGGVAHDFNNMLSVILGYSEIALLKVDKSQSIFNDILEIRKATNRSADLTRQLLTFARKQTVVAEVLNLNEAVSGMLKMLKRLITERIKLDWQPENDLWKVKMDPSQLDQILANLCVNARDAITGVGNITIATQNITIFKSGETNYHELQPGDYVLLSVSDDGCGMDKTTLSKIFEPFFTTKEVGHGTGLGLATTYGIVKQNNGQIKVTSELGHGSTFKIYLPRFFDNALNSDSKKTKPRIQHGDETILLVEDESAILQVTQQMLERLDYNVLATTIPNEAIRLAKEHKDPIDILLTDVIMPEMNGRELAKILISIYPKIKCLFMSGYTGQLIPRGTFLEEDLNFIQKPFSFRQLAKLIRKTLAKPNSMG